MLVETMDMLSKEPTTSAYLMDANERRMYASYLWTSREGKKFWEVPPTSCELTPSLRQKKFCTSREEFDSFVATYMELTASEPYADGCTRNHELYRIVPEYRAVLLDGGDIKRAMFADWKDERLSIWKPGHNITFCPDENKMINTTINSGATLLSEFMTTCKPLLLSDEIDRALEHAWEYANQPNGNPTPFVTEAKSRLGWYYEVCTDHEGRMVQKR